MDLTKGFQLHRPPKFVPWRIRDLELEDLFDGFALKKVKRGYYTLKCEPFSGLPCFIGFHLHEYDVLTELEFFVPVTDVAEIKQSYEMFQRHFETVFGKPSKTTSGEYGFQSYEWIVPGARIVHMMRERHGPEELARIIRRRDTEQAREPDAR